MMAINPSHKRRSKAELVSEQGIALFEGTLAVLDAEPIDWKRFAEAAQTPAPPVSQRNKANVERIRDGATWQLLMIYKEAGPLKKMAPLAGWTVEHVRRTKGEQALASDPLPLLLHGVGLFYQAGATHAPYHAPELWQALQRIEMAFKNDDKDGQGRIGPKNTLLGKGVWARICRIRGDDAKCDSLLKEIQDWLDWHPYSMSPVDAKHCLAEECNWAKPDEDWMVQHMRFQGGQPVGDDPTMWMYPPGAGGAPPS